MRLSLAARAPPRLSPRIMGRGGTSWQWAREARCFRASVLLVGQELATHGQAHAVAFLVGLPLDRHVEIDGAHDPVAEFLVDERLPGRAVDLQQLVEAIDRRI